MTLKIGVLGMADNRITPMFVSAMASAGWEPSVQVLLRPGLRGQRRRLVRKIRSAGLIATARRVVDAIRRSRSADPGQSRERIFLVSDLNSDETRDLLVAEDLDLLIALTDTLLGRGTFSLARLGCLNAHPGWLPRYRGLGSTLAMLRDGLSPAVTVHFIDEGIDTGPVLARRSIDPRGAGLGSEAESIWVSEAADLLSDVLHRLKRSEDGVIDTFLEPSSMTRGFPARYAKQLVSQLTDPAARLDRAEDRFGEPCFPPSAPQCS